MYLCPVSAVQQLRRAFEQTQLDKEEILKKSEEMIKKRNINRHFDTQIQQFKFQKEILNAENFQSLCVSDPENSKKFLQQLQAFP